MTAITIEPELMTLYRGIAFAETWGFLDTDREPIDLAGGTLEGWIKESAGSGRIDLTVVAAEETGQIVVSIAAEDISAIAGGIAHWTVVFTDSLGAPQVATGPVRVEEI